MRFRRPKGFAGSIPREWISRNLPICPFCKKNAMWRIAYHWHWLWARYHFRCSNCAATVSVPVARVAIIPVPTGLVLSVAAPQTIRLESVGRSGVLVRVGLEYQLMELVRMSGRR